MDEADRSGALPHCSGYSAHDALADTRACIRVYQAIRNPGQKSSQQALFDGSAEDSSAAHAG